MRRIAASVFLLAVGCAAPRSATKNSSPPISPSPAPSNEKQGAAAVDAALTPTDVQRIVHDGTPTLRACYERNINVSSAEDKLKVRWVIGKNGRPSDIQIEETTIQAAAFTKCLIETIAAWTFPIPNQTVEVSFPFIFRSSE